MFSCYGALLPLILLLLMSSSALLPVMACASVKSAEILAQVSKMFCWTGKPIIVPNSCALPMVPVAIIESLMVKPKGLFWIVRAVTLLSPANGLVNSPATFRPFASHT